MAAKVAAEMAALVTQMTAVKGAVNQVRDQARAAFHGKLSPIAGNFQTVGCYVSRFNSPTGTIPLLGGSNCGLPALDPNYYRTAGTVVLEPPPFNMPLEPCSVSAPPCLDDQVTTAQIASVGTAVAALSAYAYANAYGGVTLSPYMQQQEQRDQDVIARLSTLAPEVSARGEDRVARQRQTIALAMNLVEEWRGCQPFTPLRSLDPSDSRLPCVTNNGEGATSSGTVGMMQELGAQLELIQGNHDGDASINQVGAMLLQVNLSRARLQAALIEMNAAAGETQQEAAVNADATRRRAEHLIVQRLDCQAGRLGPPAHPFNNFVPDYTDPAGGVCVGNP